MGIIDTATIILTCPGCDLSEQHRAVDRGNQWTGAWWSLPRFERFRVVTSTSREESPSVIATCGQCGTAARTRTVFG